MKNTDIFVMRCLYRFKKVFLCVLTCICAAACTFDYGQTETSESLYPEITMEDLDYARVRKGSLIARLQAEFAERYEKRRRMELKNYSFEQYNTTNEEIDAAGSGGSATVELDTSNIHMSDGVEITIDTEDLALETVRLDWDDGKKTLKGGERDTVKIEQSNGTNFGGVGFSADVRSRIWAFSSSTSGIYVHEDEDEDSDQSPDAGVSDEEDSGENPDAGVSKEEDRGESPDAGVSEEEDSGESPDAGVSEESEAGTDAAGEIFGTETVSGAQ